MYQTRSNSRNCFASALSTETNKVLAYDVACNSCSRCTDYELKGPLTEDQSKIWKPTERVAK